MKVDLFPRGAKNVPFRQGKSMAKLVFCSFLDFSAKRTGERRTPRPPTAQKL